MAVWVADAVDTGATDAGEEGALELIEFATLEEHETLHVRHYTLDITQLAVLG